MKICLFSDSHGSARPMITAIKRENPQLCFFLGDGERDLAAVQDHFPDLPFYAVRGNCDLRSRLSASLTCAIGGVRIFATHGHLYQVKYEPALETLTAAAREADAAIALFGHTHQPCCMEKDGITLLNPGSVSRSLHPRYGLLILEDGAFRAELKSL